MEWMTVGSWNFAPRNKGVAVYQLTSGTCVQKLLPEITVGCQFADPERGILYITNETSSYGNGMNPGGEVLALKLEKKTGIFSVISACGSGGSKPSYVWMDNSKSYLLVSHHAGRNPVVKVEGSRENGYEVLSVYDDTTLALFRLESDGSVGSLCDLHRYQGTNVPGLHCQSHLHCIAGNADGSVYVACDKGLDRIYSYCIQREQGQLIPLDSVEVEAGSAPRYAVFHPILPLIYVNHEERSYLSVFRYDKQGKLHLCKKVNMLDAPQSSQPSDLKVSADGKMLYAAIRGADKIAVFRLDAGGIPQWVQNCDCGGKTPRGLAISMDGEWLFSANQDTDSVTRMKIDSNGLPESPEIVLREDCPGNLWVWETLK